jgi:hypothetical protein
MEELARAGVLTIGGKTTGGGETGTGEGWKKDC